MKKRRFRYPQLMLLAFVMSAGAIRFNQESAFAEESCGDHGTSVEFVSSPAEAAKQALKEEKLVFVLHVSGHFEEPEYT